MIQTIIALPWIIVLILLYALLRGQPDETMAIYAQATQNTVQLQTMTSRPTPTLVPCHSGSSAFSRTNCP